MSYLRDVAGILKRRFPNLTVDETLELGEQLVAVHDTRRIDQLTALVRDIRQQALIDENAVGSGPAFREIRRLVEEFDRA